MAAMKTHFALARHGAVGAARYSEDAATMSVMGFRQVVFMVPYGQTVTVDSVYCTNIIVPRPANVMVAC